MTPEEAAAAILLGIGAVTAIVGQRVYVGKAPQRGQYPLVVVQLVHAPTDYHLRGGEDSRARIQVDGYAHESGADPYGDVTALANAIHGDNAGSGLSGWRGSIGSPPFNVRSIQRIERVPDYEPDELRLLRQRQDYWIYFN